MIGKQLAHYEVVSELGRGGMGEVYRARDTKLGREVAIKVLPAEFAEDAERLARLEREARMLAALNHPNIAAIYGLEQSDDARFLVLELVEGDTLADQIKRGALPVADALKLALQIAEALEAAHEKGVIHRDLKPANIKVTPDGKVKVLDFGLAKAFSGDQADVNLSNSPTLSMQATQQGVVLGTAAYMSPEQANGEVADKRADIWSFGVVLFEMLTGRPLFTGKTVSYILADVLRSDPDWSGLPAQLHPRVRMLLERSLEKDAKDRLSGISDARVEIQKALADPDGVLVRPVTDSPPPAGASRLGWIAATLVLAALTGLTVWNLRGSDPRPVSRFDYELPEGIAFRNSGRPVVAISPTGEHFVYNGTAGLYLRSRDELDARLIPGTEVPLANPVFSPDGQDIAYWLLDGQFVKLAVSGGAPIVLAEGAAPFGMSWERDGTILYGQADGIWQISENGGTPVQVVAIGPEERADGPQLLPGGEWILFTLTQAGAGVNRWNNADVVIESLASGERRVLRQGGSDARYIPTGHLVYAFEDGLFALPFDVGSLEVSGGPVSIVQGVQRAANPAANTGAAFYSFSDEGTFVYVPGAGAQQAVDGVLAFADRSGVRQLLDLPPAPYRSPRVSPDGSQIAVEIIGDDGESDIWVYDLSETSAIRRLTGEGNNTRPVWTPDSQRLTFASDREGAWGIYWQAADGSDVPERLTTAEDDVQHLPESWAPDASALSFVSIRDNDWSIWTLSTDSGETEVFRDGPTVRDFGSAFSPDGNWLAFTTFNADGTNLGVRVQPYPPTGVDFEVLDEGESWPVWSADGDQLISRLNLAAQQLVQLKEMDVSTGGTFAFGTPRTLPMQGSLVFQNYRDYDVAPDGERFLMIFSPDQGPAAEAAGPQINIVLNWFTELRERVPVD